MKAAAETIAKPVPVQRYRFTVEQYHRMGELGLFAAAPRVELIHGEIIEMSPINSPHSGAVNRLNRLLNALLGETALISVQNPVAITSHSEPEPDVAVLRVRADFYANAHPKPEEVLLVIEVADTSAEKDRQIKLPLYAAAGIPEAWLVDLNASAVEVHTQPSAQGYSNIQIFRHGDVIHTPTVDSLATEAILG